MEERAPVTPVDVLAALADLSPTSEARSTALTVPTAWFRWLDLQAAELAGPVVLDAAGNALGPHHTASVDRAFGERLAAIDQIRPLQNALRVGWLFVTGRHTTEDGRTRQVFLPLVSVPVRVTRAPLLGDAGLHAVGDPEATALIADREARQRAEDGVATGGGAFQGVDGAAAIARLLPRLDGLKRYAHETSVAAGFPPGLKLVPADAGPEQLLRQQELRIVVGVAVFALDEASDTTRAGALRAWAGRPVDPVTAFHALYSPDPPVAAPVASVAVDSPFALTPAQGEAVVRSRTSPVTVVSGAPGTGKSHTLVAVATDAMARGETVLVAAKSDATVDALLGLLERAPGPKPVVFGSAERRQRLAEALAAGQLLPTTDTELAQARDHLVEVLADRDGRRREIGALLAAETNVDGEVVRSEEARVLAPGLFDPGLDLDAVVAGLADAATAGGSWWARRKRRRRWSSLRARLGLSDSLDPAAARELVEVARVTRAATSLREAGGLDPGAAFTGLRDLDLGSRRAMASWLAAQSRSRERLTGAALGAVAALATSLRSGRSARRDQLARMDGTLTRALPLWVGTLGDIDDLLPPHPGLFDLVIVDEASSIEQPLAVPALLRGKRAVVAGDPRQLRHVSFLADERHREVMAAHHIDRVPVLAARLDVRRNSLFDVAAGTASVTVLDEHFRSDPHLVDFVARRLYDGQLTVATRSPVTEVRDCIEVRRLGGERDADGVVAAEVSAVVTQLRALRSEGASSVGVVTPFRAQADALETAVLAAFTADDLEALDLRVGTVHGFQGNERDVVIVSLGLGEARANQPWTFVDDPHLFAVLATRARRRMIVLHSADPPPGSLVADFLAQDDVLPARAGAIGDPTSWTAEVAAALRGAGVPVRTGYPTGRHVLDLCLDERYRALAFETEVHPDGPDAHIERRLALDRAGWDVVDLFRSRWDGRTGAMVLHVLDALGRS